MFARIEDEHLHAFTRSVSNLSRDEARRRISLTLFPSTTSISMNMGEAPRSQLDAEEILDVSLFSEPDGYRQSSPPPKIVTHTLLSGRVLRLRLVGQNPLWVSSPRVVP